MIQFNFVEDYIEYIAGLRDDLGQPLLFFARQSVRINLARYDVQIVDSLAFQTSDTQVPYTDKQADLALKIVNKYRKQLANLSKPVIVPEDDLKFRLGIRQVDRSKKIFLDNNDLIVKFPFDHKIIAAIKSCNTNLPGHSQFLRDRKVWKFGLTENTINFAVNLGRQFDFEIEPDVLELNRKIETMESDNAFRIELQLKEDQVVLINAAPDLVEYIEEHCGGLCKDNLVKLVDMSSVLGYTVDDQIKNWIDQTIDRDLIKYLDDRKINIDKSENFLNEILSYASLTDRLPIHLYDIGTPKSDNENIIYLNSKRANTNLGPMKLLVSFSPILVGGKKSTWLTKAEKVIIVK